MNKYFKLWLLFIFIVVGAACATTEKVIIPLTYVGTNLDGAQFGTKLPGVEGIDYSFPTTADIDYFASKNMNTIRLGFQWERLQPVLMGEFNNTYLTKLDNLVKYANSKKITVLLNPHNFARYKINGVNEQLVGSTAVSNAAFADLWKKIAVKYNGNNKVMFGLVNEPHDMPTRQWVSAANEAIKAIRSAGNKNVISVPGNAWTGAASWSSSWSSGYDVSNAVAMLEIVDPLNNFIFEVHNYFDADGSGSYVADCPSQTEGSKKLANVTTWARTNKKKVLVAEFGTIITNNCKGSVNDMLTYLNSNQDVYVGWLWWSGGTPWGTSYKLGLNPKNGQDDVRMSWLTPFLPNQPATAPTTTSVPTAVPTQSPTKPSNPIAYTANTAFTVNSGTTNWVWVPSSYDNTHNTPISLLVWAHGCGGMAQYDISHISNMPNQNWISLAVGGREGSCWSNYTTDGSKILNAIADIKTKFNVNPKKVVYGGYSSGGDIGYELLFKNASLFAGAIFENTGPSTAAMTAADTASWKLNIAQLSHIQDTTYPIAQIRTKMNTLKSKGFLVNFMEKDGTHWDNDNGQFGTIYDLRTYLLPFMNAGWTSGNTTVDAGVSDAGTLSDAGGTDASIDSGTNDASVSPIFYSRAEVYNQGAGWACAYLLVTNNTNVQRNWSNIYVNMKSGRLLDYWFVSSATPKNSGATGSVKFKPIDRPTLLASEQKKNVGGFCYNIDAGGTHPTVSGID